MGNDPKTVRFAPKETLVVMKGKLPLDYLTGECHHFSEGVWFGELRNKRPFGKGIFAYKDGRVKSGQVEGGRFVGEPLNEVQRKVFHSRSQELLIKSVTRKPSRTLEIKC